MGTPRLRTPPRRHTALLLPQRAMLLSMGSPPLRTPPKPHRDTPQPKTPLPPPAQMLMGPPLPMPMAPLRRMPTQPPPLRGAEAMAKRGRKRLVP